MLLFAPRNGLTRSKYIQLLPNGMQFFMLCRHNWCLSKKTLNMKQLSMKIKQLSMKKTVSVFNRALLIPVIALSFTPLAFADSMRLGGGLRHGMARPPLHLTIKPLATAAWAPYSPKQIRHAYGVDQLTVTGSQQKIAIVDAYGDPSIQTDLNNFCSYYGISTTTVQILYPQGQPRVTDTGWALETALDVEWAHAIAPGDTIIVSVAKSASINDLIGAVDAAVNAGAKVVSMSWGAPEFAGQAAYDSHFNKPGVTFVASSGDYGESTGVEWPACSPNVIGVGGTSLYLDNNGNRTAETAWSGSGGGISAYTKRPAFQTGWQIWGGGRGVPDVSLVADPNTGVGVYYGRHLYGVGGTSASAPQWAALVALSNQAQGSPLSGGPVALYNLATRPGCFFDIIGGSNGTDQDDFAVQGYDLVTGLGSPKAVLLVPNL